jgi:IclR family transcriptional regulator, pca regulon regulatory protein
MSTVPAFAARDMIAGLEKGLAVLELFGARSPRLTIAGAALGAGVSRAAARRVLLTLVQAGYLETDGKFFMPTQRVLRLSRGFIAGRSLPETLQPLLDRISRLTGESASAAILDGVEIVYVARAGTRRIMSIGLGVGSRLPAHATSMGRAMLAFLPEDVVSAFLRKGPFERFTVKTVTDSELLRRELVRVRAQGFALVDEELELGLRSIAVPLLVEGQVEAAINVSVSTAQMRPAEMQERLLPVLRDAAAQMG